jgi:hypothetical protein
MHLSQTAAIVPARKGSQSGGVTIVKKGRFDKELKKEEREWAALRLIYNERTFASIAHHDPPDPDFVLRHHGAVQSFGVEVTDLYETESDARAAQHPDYIVQLLAGEPPMHKDDATVFEVVPVDLQDSEGNLKAAGIPAIVRPIPPPERRSEAIAAVLERKSAQARGYPAELGHTNLIIVDRFGVGHEGPVRYSTRELFIPDLRTALAATPFREVYLTGLSGKSRVYRPLQLLLFVEAFEFFLGALESFLPELSTLAEAAIVPLFVQLTSEAAWDVRLGPSGDGRICALYRGVGITYSDDGIKLLDFRDHDLPPSMEVPASTLGRGDLAAFKAHYATFAEGNHFMTELAMPVLSDSDAGGL